MLLGLWPMAYGVCIFSTGWPGNLLVEQVFAYPGLGEATVQAALGAVPLSRGIEHGDTILALAVLSILFTAPLGLFAIRIGGPRLLSVGTTTT